MSRGYAILLLLLACCSCTTPASLRVMDSKSQSLNNTNTALAVVWEAYGGFVKAIDGQEVGPPKHIILANMPRMFTIPAGLHRLTLCDYDALGKPYWINNLPVYLEAGRHYTLGEIAPVLKDSADGTVFPTAWIKY